MSTSDPRAEHEHRRQRALAMGGPAKLERRRAAGILNARERIDALLDADSWYEVGLFATSHLPEDADTTPTDGKVTGFGRIERRPVAVMAYDFTVKGSSSSRVGNRKMAYIKEQAARREIPVVYLAESTGVRMPDIMGGRGMGMLEDGARMLRRRESPWVSGVFGYAFGSAAWHTALADFAVMRKGSLLAVSSPKLVEMATRQSVDPEQLGGWELHFHTTGLVDRVVDSDDEAVALLRTFLGYLPSGGSAAPPRLEPAGPSVTGEHEVDLLSIVPESPRRVYDVRGVLDAVLDRSSWFELKQGFGTSLVTGLGRIDGRTVGVIASNPIVNGGALDADACRKATSAIVLFDSFNIPIVFFADQPGFLIGTTAEADGIVGHVINWMNALALCTVPRITIIMRKSYGQAYINMGGGGTADHVAAWRTAEVSFMQAESAAFIVHGAAASGSDDGYERAVAEMRRSSTAYDLAAVFGAHDVIEPQATRGYLTATLALYDGDDYLRLCEHHLANWPTTI